MKTLFCILIVLSPLCAKTQIDKGQYLIGGNLQASFTDSEERKFFFGEIQPNAGYFVMDKLATGIRTGFSYYRDFVGEEYYTTNLFVGPFARYYFLNKSYKTNIFADVSPAYSFGKFKYLSLPTANKWSSFSLQFLMGSAIFLNQHTALEFTLGYKFNSRGDVPDSTRAHAFNVGVGFQIHL